MNGPMLLCRPHMQPSDRSRPVRPETRELTELRALKTRLPELAPAIDMQVEFVELHRRIQLRVSTPSPVPPGERQARLGQGRRALELADVPIEWADAGLAARQTADILHRHEAIDPADHRSLVALVREGADLAPLVRAWYAETAQGPITQAPASTRPPMLDEVLQLALRPFFGRAVEVAERGVDLAGWGRPWCPFCGATPDLAVYLDEDHRQLICSRCIGRWEWESVGCPWCPTRDRRLLPTFTSPDRRYRLCACDGCRRYLKAYNANGAPRPVMPVVDAIATLPLDAAAVQRGYVGE
jgi:Protein involved in formate dehydrogenase formation